MQAVLAFSTALLAWETNSEETRALGTKYSLNAHSLLSEASAGGNSDALLAALILLSWIETTWYVPVYLVYYRAANNDRSGTDGVVLRRQRTRYVILDLRPCPVANQHLDYGSHPGIPG